MTVRRDPDGRWRYRVKIRLADGTRPRISGTAPKHENTKDAAQQAEREHIALVQQGAIAPGAKPGRETEAPRDALTLAAPAPMFREFVADHMVAYAKTNNKPSEQVGKEKAFRRHLLPTLGDLRLDEIRVKEVEVLKGELLAKGLKRKSVNNILVVLNKTMRYAQELEIIREIPRIRMLKFEKPPFQFLDFAQYAQLLETAKAEPEWYAAILLAGDAGLRRGEIRSLRWDDWERRNGRLAVSRSMWQGIEGSTKSWQMRTVPTTQRLNVALAAARHLRGRTVMATMDGHAMTNDVMDRALPRLCRRAGIPVIGWHALRHTFCSHLAIRGAPARVIQELAGHASLTTTLRYMHLVVGATDQAIALLEQPAPQMPSPCQNLARGEDAIEASA